MLQLIREGEGQMDSDNEKIEGERKKGFYSAMESESEKIGEEANKEGFFSVYGIYFCELCKNMLRPSKATGEILQLYCMVCGDKEINFGSRKGRDCMVYSKELQAGSRKMVYDSAFIFDPTTPRVQVTCPDCEYHEAIYFLVPDDGERKIIVKLLCASADETDSKCDYLWDLPEEDALYKTIIRPNHLK